MHRRDRAYRWPEFGLRAAIVSAALVSQFAGCAYASTGAPAPFVHDRAALEKYAHGAAIDSVPGGCLVLTPAEFAAPTPATDPDFSWHYAQAAYVYASRQVGASRGYFRVVTVHYEPEQREQARRTANLIARLWATYRDHFGNAPAFPLQSETADVYLAQQTAPGAGDVGGRTRNDNIYIFGAGADSRTPLEWVRTLTHEWGHLTLSAARGYIEPEEDAAGYLGERLFLKWMREDEAKRPADAADDGTAAADLDLYYNRQIAPLIARFEDDGPGSAELDGTDTTAMDYYIGAVLATDQDYGSHVAGRALYTVLDDKARSFLVALRTLIADRPDFSVQTPAWVPLRKGAYSVATSSATSAHPTTLRVATTGWQRITGGHLHFHRLEAAH